jgi:hypothetical protein
VSARPASTAGFEAALAASAAVLGGLLFGELDWPSADVVSLVCVNFAAAEFAGRKPDPIMEFASLLDGLRAEGALMSEDLGFGTSAAGWTMLTLTRVAE